MLLLGIRGSQNLAASGGQLRQRRPRSWRRGFRRRLGMDHLVLEPVGKVGRAASFTLRWFRLALALRATGRAFDADVEMIIVAVHRPDLGKPAAVTLGF